MKTITYENGLLYLPEHEQDVIDLIQQARQQEKEIRVRGSGHSVSASIYADGFGGGQDNPDNIDMMLSYMDAVRFEDATMQVTVQAGCRSGMIPSIHLGFQPRKTACSIS
ncbi:FAD-dependent oxidoreductase [Chloroflexi bacterium TSY]|nr:FAD-dependent oxidoreductase [Chloroflexi bacterium TSY]